MKYKILSLVFLMMTLFSNCIIYEHNVKAMASPYLCGQYEKDIVGNDNAIINVKLNNLERKNIYALQITVTSENSETIKYQKCIKCNTDNGLVTFDVKKDTGRKLEPGKKYEYTITPVCSESINESMYTLKNYFLTNNVKIVSKLENIQKDNAFVRVKVANPKREKLMKMGVKIFSNGRLLKDCSKDLCEEMESCETVFNIKDSAQITLKQNKKYQYCAYVVIDVSQSHLYKSICVDEGGFRTLAKTTVVTKIHNSKKMISFKNKISNPYEKRLSSLKLIMVVGKKKYEVYNKKIDPKNCRRSNQVITIKVKKTKLKKIIRKRKCQYIVLIRIGSKNIKATYDFQADNVVYYYPKGGKKL